MGVIRPFRFAAGIAPTGSRTEFIEHVRQVEQLGYSCLLLSDHLINELAPISALAVAAAVTDRLRLGSFVFNNDLRHPVVLAQELASLDRLSEGRLEVGIGAGWNIPEYDAAGIAFDPGTVRIDRLSEAVSVLKGLFSDGPVDAQGRFYRVKGFAEFVRPLQRPHPPLFIGGGSPRLLRLAAREADIVGLAPRVGADGLADVRGAMLQGTREKVGIIREAAAERFEQLEINTYPSLGSAVTDDARVAAGAVAERLRRRYRVDLSQDEILGSPHVFIGSIDGLAEKFQSLREGLGISYIFVGDEFREFAPLVERLSGR